MGSCKPRLRTVDADKALMADPNVRYRKTLRDLGGLYGDRAAFEALLVDRADDVVYEVASFTRGDLIMGVTRMAAGKVGDEYFFTRGHMHAKPACPEIHVGRKGRGLMLMESPQGDIRIVEIGPRSMCYVPPLWIHRSVNTGTEDLVMLFACPADAGQDDRIIAASGGMRVRIVDDGAGGWRQTGNPTYRPRSAETVGRLMSKAAAVA